MDSNELQRAARWKYEQGRALVALPAAVAALAVVILSYPLGPGPDVVSLLIGAFLVVLSFHFASRGGPFSRAVFPALGAALLPLSIPPLVFRVGAAGWGSSPADLCLWACLFSGGAAAALLVLLTRRVVQNRRILLALSGLLAGIGGAVSCLRLGMMGLGPYLVGLGVGLAPFVLAGSGARRPRRRS